MKRAFLVLSLVASVAGALISTHLLVGAKGCVAEDYFACSPVLSSQYSQIYGFPIAGLGLLWFSVAALMAIGGLTGSELATRQLFRWSILGLAGLTLLIVVEIFFVGAVCPLCTAAHILGVSILASSYMAIH